MTRTLEAVVAAAIRREQGEIIHLIELEFSGGTLYISTGPHNLSWGGNTYQGVGGHLGFEGVPETAQRRGQGVRVALSGVDQTIISAVLGQGHVGRALKIYRARIWSDDNFVDESEGFDQWSQSGTPVLTSGQTDPFGRTDAWKVQDDDAVNYEFIYRAVAAFGSGGKKGVGFHVGKGASPDVALVKLRDTVAAADRAILAADFTVTPPQFSASVGTLVEARDIAPDWWWIRLLSAAVTPANSHRLELYPAGSAATATGDALIFGAQVTDYPGIRSYAATFGAAVQDGALLGNPLLLWKGYMNTAFEIEEERSDRDTPSVKISTRVVSRTAEMQRIRGICTNLTSHQAVYDGDTFFEFVARLRDRRIFWGTESDANAISGGSGGGGGGPEPLPWDK